MVLLRQDRLRRAWIFLVPLLLYAGWWFWAQQFDQGRVEASNLLHVGKFFADSIAIDAGAITGVNIPWSRFGSVDSVTQAPASPLGWLVALLILVVVIWRIIRGNVPRSLYASIGILATYWLAAALADFPSVGRYRRLRYVYPSSIGLLLVLVAAAQGSVSWSSSGRRCDGIPVQPGHEPGVPPRRSGIHAPAVGYQPN